MSRLPHSRPVPCVALLKNLENHTKTLTLSSSSGPIPQFGVSLAASYSCISSALPSLLDISMGFQNLINGLMESLFAHVFSSGGRVSQVASHSVSSRISGGPWRDSFHEGCLKAHWQRTELDELWHQLVQRMSYKTALGIAQLDIPLEALIHQHLSQTCH